MVTRRIYDALGRTTHTVENYKAGYWTSEPDQPASRSSDVNRVTQTIYNNLGQVTQLVAIDPDADGNTSDNQVMRRTLCQRSQLVERYTSERQANEIRPRHIYLARSTCRMVFPQDVLVSIPKR